jgi:toxin ParE1/3/4
VIPVLWSRRAERDLQAIRSYIAQHNPQAAEGVARRIRDVVLRLSEHPELGARVPNAGVRRIVVSGTPYLVYYRVAEDHVRLMRVLHGARVA